jgi:hypothetical protein
MKLQSGDYFTIYDFGGLVPGSIAAPDGWTSSVANATTAPVGLNPNDDPNIADLTFKYTGPTQTGQIGLGNFWANSTVGTTTITDFTGQNPQASTGNTDRNIVSTIAPGVPSGGNGGNGVPEPTTLALAGLGLPLVGVARMIRRKKA